jgi:cobalt transporter subunit CbtA
MFQRVFITALVAGVFAGVLAFSVQRIKVVPLIHQAEVYETAAIARPPHDHAGSEHSRVAEKVAVEKAWEPEEGFERTAYTLLADIVAGTGFSLLLSGLMALAGIFGHQLDFHRGLLWGAAGFVAFTLAPSLGLPPELPGMEATDLSLRQAWWVATVLATALGLAIMAFRPEPALRVAGFGLLILPHLIGAPHSTEHGGSVPAELAAQFATASIAAAGLFWIVLGGAIGWLYRRLG